MRNNLGLFLLLLVVFAFTSRARAASSVADPTELRLRLGSVLPSDNLSQVKIAILDNGFGTFAPGKGMLPDSAELIDGPLRYPTTSSHGLGMAQILWAVTGNKPSGPKMYLINTNGFTNFKAAVDFVIQNKIDIVLYSQIWLFGSNFDGKGFINEVVNKATDQGVIWINAAGNLGGHVYSGKVQGSKAMRLNNKLDENSFTVTLTWDDFSDSEQVCATKDLDLELVDSSGSVRSSATLVQNGTIPDPKDPKDTRSCYARETLSVTNLERGDFTFRVVDKSSNFSKRDSFKVIITDHRPDSLEFTDHSVGYEIMPPADNARVLTIGDKSSISSIGPTADGRMKPDAVVSNSRIAFTNGNESYGSSNAAAMVAGSVAIMKSLKPSLKIEELLKFSERIRFDYFAPSQFSSLSFIPEWVKKFIPVGGDIKLHPATGRYVIFATDDPIELPLLVPFRLNAQSDELVACNEFVTSCELYARNQDSVLAPPMIEFRQFLMRANPSVPGIWKTPRQR